MFNIGLVFGSCFNVRQNVQRLLQHYSRKINMTQGELIYTVYTLISQMCKCFVLGNVNLTYFLCVCAYFLAALINIIQLCPCLCLLTFKPVRRLQRARQLCDPWAPLAVPELEFVPPKQRHDDARWRHPLFNAVQTSIARRQARSCLIVFHSDHNCGILA